MNFLSRCHPILLLTAIYVIPFNLLLPNQTQIAQIPAQENLETEQLTFTIRQQNQTLKTYGMHIHKSRSSLTPNSCTDVAPLRLLNSAIYTGSSTGCFLRERHGTS
ncbi:hypothetical protein [Merismopedia glauca]|uniref:hypothetical protein n=1 Tax=Merismopedia glauca TaxID=292586 RepID=UPI0026783356